MRSHWPLVISLIVLTSSLGPGLCLSAVASAEDWPQFLRSNDHQPLATGTIPDHVEKAWEFDFNGTTTTSPTVSGGRLYFGAMLSSAEGHDRLYCLDAATGEQLWTFDCALENPSLYGLCSSPCVSGGNIFFGTSDYTAYCLDAATGSKVWSYDLLQGEIPSVHYGACSSPLIYEGKVYFGTDEGGAPNLFCLDAVGNGDGTTDQIWNYSSPDNGVVFSSPAVEGGKLVIGTYVGRTAGEVICLDATGNGDGTTTQYWHYGIPCATFSSACISGGNAYIGHGDYQNKDLGVYNVYCIPMDSSGELKPIDEKWHYMGNDQFLATPISYDGNVYAGDLGGLFHCIKDQANLDRSADDAWTFDAGAQIWATATMVGDRLLIGDYDGDLYCLKTTSATATGEQVWTMNLASSPIYSTCAFVDGKIYVSANDGKVFCLVERTQKPPKVVSTTPTDGAKDVVLDNVIEVRFDMDMDSASLKAAFMISPAADGKLTVATRSLKFAPDPPLAPSTKYSITIKATARSAPGDGLDGNGDGKASGSPADDYTFELTTDADLSNLPPELSEISVDPTTGDDSTTFEFFVRYRDADNDPPQYVRMLLDGVNYEMQLYSGDAESDHDLDYINGEGYVFGSTLGPGIHIYSFTCSDGTDVADSEEMTLTVDASTPSDDDALDDDGPPMDDDTQDDDAQGPGGLGGNAVYYVLAGVGALLLLTLVIAIVVKRRRSQ